MRICFSVLNHFSSILYITFDAREPFSLIKILRGSGEIEIMTQMLPITLQARYMAKCSALCKNV